MPDLLTMLSYKRPSKGRHTQKFANRFLKPVFGDPDPDGNYMLGSGPIVFASHYDTVHDTSGRQTVRNDQGILSAPHSNCLGADCTTGVWLMLKMIEAGVPGRYIVHADEEVGCKGSSALVANKPDWLATTDAVISFDRYGTESIITHQMGRRTASDAFADSLADILALPLFPDPDGSYTDSNEYADDVPECTNISVGYYDQHTKKETQDLEFAEKLLAALIRADWSQLVIDRDPAEVEYSDWGWTPNSRRTGIASLVYYYPDDVAAYLKECGFTEDDIRDGIGLRRRELV